jgi:Uma2 family endonuclease
MSVEAPERSGYPQSMPGPVKRNATYQDVLDAPEHEVAEIVDGDLYLSPRPAAPHASVSSILGEELGPPFRRGKGGPGGWIILDEPELHLRNDVLVPDLASWKRERMPQVEDVPYFTLAPDWLCEVLSPSTAKLDRARKLAIYAREGVKHVWLVDPHARTHEVLRLEDSHWLLLAVHQDSERVRAEPFELDLAVLWSDLATAGE